MKYEGSTIRGNAGSPITEWCHPDSDDYILGNPSPSPTSAPTIEPTTSPTDASLTQVLYKSVLASENPSYDDCANIPASTPYLKLVMGTVVDYFRPVVGKTFCDMLNSNNLHEWSNDGLNWVNPVLYNHHLGGSAHNYPFDGRQWLSFWGGNGNQGGCCHYSYQDSPSWGRSFDLFYPGEVLPPQEIIDWGYPNCGAGWFDVQQQGVANDYCRWVGNSGCRNLGHSTPSWWSCALAGTTEHYTLQGSYFEGQYRRFDSPGEIDIGVKCADETGQCSCNGEVRYGANGVFSHSRGVSGSIDCNNSVFGDPLPWTVKACYCKERDLRVKCADETGECSCKGKVIYGANGVFSVPLDVYGSTYCGNSVFGDPIPGTYKACYCYESA